MRIGQGYDVHAFADNRKLILGGVEVPHDKGLAGHSDADVLIHAICDAILGAAALGDIGKHFPDTSADFKNIDSRILLRQVTGLIEDKGYSIGNLDATIIAQKPKLASFIVDMRQNLADDLGVKIDQVNVKATTTEKLGFEGRAEGIAAQAVVLLLAINS
jgi:2-C-methyl-D-erythritol 2,4-cyclodiphosphate synthase